MGVWPRFLFLLFPNNLAWCSMETGFPPCAPGPPAHLASSLSSRRPEEDRAHSSRGEGAAVKDTKGTELSCFPFSSRVPGTPHASLSTVRLGCGGGGKERGTGTSPRFGFERCTAEVRPTPPVTAGQPHVTIPLLSSGVCLCGASKRACKPSPWSRQLWWCP